MIMIIVLYFILNIYNLTSATYCSIEDTNCDVNISTNKYLKDKWKDYNSAVESAVSNYVTCDASKCSCHYPMIKEDLLPFKGGIKKEDLIDHKDQGILYQIIDHKLYREENCMFPSRCSGVEHFILKIIEKLPDMEFILNTRDWPQVHKNYGRKIPVFSFSKTSDYLDILYPAWTFWEGGPAIGLYPMGLGRWDKHIKSLTDEADKWPWHKKFNMAFFRGSRTSSERDALVLLSRENPSLVDAKYTKNQAWKSDVDTLGELPATEVPLEDHCHYKYLFNYRGVAASFRLKHLFLCQSLVLHVGSQWVEFFYKQLTPWVHYVPVEETSSKEDIRSLLDFVQENDDLMQAIAMRGHTFIRDHLRMKDVLCYWRRLLKSYAKLLLYEPERKESLIHIKKK